MAVVTFAAEAINRVDVRLKFESIGTEPVDLRIARDSCRVSVRSGDAWTTVWRSTPSTRLALVAQPDGFLDGVNSMATLEPGMVARAMLPGALSEAGEPPARRPSNCTAGSTSRASPPTVTSRTRWRTHFRARGRSGSATLPFSWP